MKVILFLVALTLFSCATAIKKEDASFSFIEQTSLEKTKAFNSALTYLAKNLGDSNYAIKIKDEANGKIITHIATECNELRAFADINNYTVTYTLEADFKDNKVKFELEGTTFTALNGINSAIVSAGAPLRVDQKDGVKACALKIKNNILSALKSGTNSNW